MADALAYRRYCCMLVMWLSMATLAIFIFSFWTQGDFRGGLIDADGTLQLAAYSIIAVLLAIGIRVSVWLMTFIETRGIMMFGANRGGRMTPAIAGSITAYGSIGWVIAALGGGLSFSAAILAFGPFTNQAAGAVFFWIGVAFVLAGFLFFEVFAWLGLRRCKFANRVRPIEASPERE